MRLRNVKGSREMIAAYEGVINKPQELKGKWAKEFGNNNPIKYKKSFNLIFAI